MPTDGVDDRFGQRSLDGVPFRCLLDQERDRVLSLEGSQIEQIEVLEERRMPRRDELSQRRRSRARDDIGHSFMSLPSRAHDWEWLELPRGQGRELLNLVDRNQELPSDCPGNAFGQVEPSPYGFCRRPRLDQAIELRPEILGKRRVDVGSSEELSELSRVTGTPLERSGELGADQRVDGTQGQRPEDLERERRVAHHVHHRHRDGGRGPAAQPRG